MKGHVKLELFDAETGELVESAEGDNLVTNAIKYVIGMYMQCGASDFYPIYAKVLGGLMLFDNTLTASADNVYFPVEAHFVAGAARGTDSSNPMGGSYNSLESGFVNGGNGFKSVWDFSTAQANGTIKSLALTGIKPSNSNNMYYSFDDVTCIISVHGVGTGKNMSNSGYAPLGFKNGYIYGYTAYAHHTETIPGSGSDVYAINIMYIRIVRTKANIVQHGVADAGDNVNLMNAYDAEIVADFDATTYKAVSHASSYTDYDYINSLYNDKCGYLYGIRYARNANGQQISDQYVIWKIAYDSWTIEKSIITSPVNLTYPTALYDGYVYYTFSSNSEHYGKIRRYSLNTGEQEILSRVCDADRIKNYYIRYIADNGLLYGIVNYCYDVTNPNYSTRYCGFLYYPDGTVVFNTLRTVNTTTDRINVRSLSDKLVNAGYYEDNYASSVCYLNNYLGTIFNLSSAITKTSSRTMKVSYTLTN